jgi:hypothetical protein
MLPGALVINWMLNYKRSFTIASYPIVLIIAVVSVILLKPILYESFSSFLSDEDTLSNVAPRKVIFQESVYIASTYFPFGSGFATFGSGQSVSNPNSVYDLTSMSGLWWYENGMYLFDFFWGSVIAETGYVGTIFYLLFLLTIFVKYFLSIGEYESSFKIRVLYVCFSLYFIFNTIGTPFLNGSLLMLLLFFCLLSSFGSIKRTSHESY